MCIHTNTNKHHTYTFMLCTSNKTKHYLDQRSYLSVLLMPTLSTIQLILLKNISFMNMQKRHYIGVTATEGE